MADWVGMVTDIVRRTAINGSSRVLEIGCGAGALLYELHRQTGCKVAGLDDSASLIEEARRHLPFGAFAHLEAAGLGELPGDFDAILSHSVFFYFPDHRYVSDVLQAAFDKLAPGGVLCLQDLNDLARQQDYEAHRRQTYPRPEDYDRDYAGLAHLYFDKDALCQELRRLGFAPVRLFEHAARNYASAAFRFNVLAVKPG